MNTPSASGREDRARRRYPTKAFDFASWMLDVYGDPGHLLRRHEELLATGIVMELRACEELLGGPVPLTLAAGDDVDRLLGGPAVPQQRHDEDR